MGDQKYILVSVAEWRAALASRAATQRFLERLMAQLDDAADTKGWVGPRMPWHDWIEESGEG
jgi:hypothetical protein